MKITEEERLEFFNSIRSQTVKQVVAVLKRDLINGTATVEDPKNGRFDINFFMLKSNPRITGTLSLDHLTNSILKTFGLETEKVICIADCPERDRHSEEHCIRSNNRPELDRLCPLGREPKWKIKQ